MFYFLFLNIFRRHQRNFHFNPVHFDSGASPLFFYYWELGNFISVYDALLLYIAPSAFTPSESVAVVIKDSRPVRRRRFDAAGASLQGIPLTPALIAPPFFPPSTFSFLGGGRTSPAPLDVSLQVCVCHVSYYLTIRLRFPPNRLSLQTLHRNSLRLHSKCQRRNGRRFLARSRFFRRYFHVARE